MLNGGYSWRLYFYVCLAFAIALLVLAFFFVEETSYDREAVIAAETLSSSSEPSGQEKGFSHQAESVGGGGDGGLNGSFSSPSFIPRRKTYTQTLSLAGKHDAKVPFFMSMARSFTYFLVPQALWVITTYGINIGLGAFVMGFTFPLKIVAPPYNWDVVSTRSSASTCYI